MVSWGENPAATLVGVALNSLPGRVLHVTRAPRGGRAIFLRPDNPKDLSGSIGIFNARGLMHALQDPI